MKEKLHRITSSRERIGISIALAAILIILLVVVFRNMSGTIGGNKGPYADFAQCIKDSGAKFYGSYWCPACNKQKERFGESSSSLPYVECSLPGETKQTPECKKDDIEAYPTWEFADGSRISENLSFEELAERTGCTAPKQ